MLHSIAFLGCLAMTQSGDFEVGPDQFVRLIEGIYSDLRDLTLIVEGERTYLGGNKKFRDESPELARSTYQSTFVVRSDGAYLYDTYIRGPQANGEDRPFTRDTISFFNKTLEELDSVPDLKQSRFQSGPGGPEVLFKTGSYGRIFFSWYLLKLGDARDKNYKYLGWEDVDGHRCLVVQFDFFGKAKANGPVHKFWIDLNRGANPLRYEFLVKQVMETRVEKIELVPFVADGGKQIWLPVKGEYQSFGVTGNVFSYPQFVETYSAVSGSVRLNKGLPDSMFTAKWTGDLAGTDEMKSLRRISMNIPKEEPGRTDAEGVKQNLDLLLAKADSQSKRLDASTAAREVWSWTPILQLVFVGSGLALLLAILAYKRRAG